MGSFIISFERGGTRYFANWSTMVDAPTSRAMTRDEFVAEYVHEYGMSGARELPLRLERAERNGTSAMGLDESLAGTVWLNRAGPRGEQLTLPGLIAIMFGEPALPEHIMPDDGDGDELSFDRWCKASGWQQ